MSKYQDKFRLVPDVDVRSKNSRKLPRRKLKILILIAFMTVVIVLFYTSTKQSVSFSEQSLSIFDDSQVQKTGDDKEINYPDYGLEIVEHQEDAEKKEENEENEEEELEESVNESNSTKYVLFWTKFFNNPDWYTGKEDAGKEVLESVQCPVTNCFFTHNKDLLERDITKFDAIAFHGPEFRSKPLPTVRSPRQLYIFVSLESPTAVLDDLNRYKDFYNLTMTYRLDSDIEFDYGKVIKIGTDEIVAPSKNPQWLKVDEDFYDGKMIEIFDKKTKNVAWFVSNCFTRSNRNNLVKKMQEFTDVDIYGKCGPLKCKVDAQECLDMLSSDYKFYLSFENSLCKDYVTEKIYRPLTQHVIPIVFNGGNTTRFAPPKSYINANDFDTAEDLVKYLQTLADNPREYIKYFWWKKHYYIKSHPTFPYTLCDLCTKLHSKQFMQATHRYADINSWYKDDMCDQRAHIKF